MTEIEKRNAIGSMRAAMHKRTDGDALANLSASELNVEYANTKQAYDRWMAAESAMVSHYQMTRQQK
jgi:hypothetical protein